MSADNLSAVRTAYDAINRGDEAILGMFDEEMIFTEPASLPWGGTYHGPEGMGALFASLAEHWDGLHLEIEDLLDMGDDVVVKARVQGTSRKTGREIDLPYLEILTLRDGKAVAGRIEMDTAKVLEVLGMTARADT